MNKSICAMCLALSSVFLSSWTSASQAQEKKDFVIEGPDGGDCESLPFPGTKTWVSRISKSETPGLFKIFGVCTIDHVNIVEGGSLIVRRSADLVVHRKLTNAGQVLIVAGDPYGSASIEFVGSGILDNSGTVSLVPHLDHVSPWLSIKNNQPPGVVNHQNGTIVNEFVLLPDNRILGGIINNFSTIENRGRIQNGGFLHNSGPPGQAFSAKIRSLGAEGILINQVQAFMENFGEITGNFTNDGTCFIGC